MNRSDFEGETPNGRTSGPTGLARRYLGWALFGAFGIGVAVGIALVAGQLASQPVGITGEPVSATSSLASPPDRPAKKRRSKTQTGSVGESSVAVAGVAEAGAVSATYGSSNSGSSGGSGSGKGYDDYSDDSHVDSDDHDDENDDYGDENDDYDDDD